MQKRLTAREKILVAVATLGVTIYLITRVLVQPTVLRWQQTGAALREAHASYIRMLKIVRLAQQRGEVNSSDTETVDRVPLLNMLRDLETAADTQVMIRRLQPLASTPISLARKRGKTPSGEIRNLQVQIDCVGQLAGLMEFIERIETASVPTCIRYLHLAPEGNGGTMLHARLTVVRLAAL